VALSQVLHRTAAFTRPEHGALGESLQAIRSRIQSAAETLKGVFDGKVNSSVSYKKNGYMALEILGNEGGLIAMAMFRIGRINGYRHRLRGSSDDTKGIPLSLPSAFHRAYSLSSS
jgi:hypothetical protein